MPVTPTLITGSLLGLLGFGAPEDAPETDAADTSEAGAPEDRDSAAGEDSSPPEDESESALEDAGSSDAEEAAPTESEGEPEAEVEGEAPEDPDEASTGEPSAAEGAAGGDADLDDIFGTSEDLDVEEVEDGDEGDEEGEGEKRRHMSGMWNGKLDARLRIVTSAYFDFDDFHDGRRWNPDQPDRGKIGRQENRLEFYFAYTPNEHIQIVGDVEPVFMGVAQTSTFDDLASRQMLTPFHIESDAAYLAVNDLLPGFDLKVGRQIVVWGTADKFNPTNNINPDDLEDRPLFTEPIANQMVVAEFSAWEDKFWAQGVYVPIFYPALLPPSATRALTDPLAPVPVADPDDLDDLQFLQNYVQNHPEFDPRVITHIDMPDTNFRNGQAGIRLGSSLGEVDFSGSYYYGFHDIPIPIATQSTVTTPVNGEERPVDGHYVQADVTLTYPHMHVAGLDFATQLPFLGHMGLWGEGAVFFPDKQYDFHIEMPTPLNIPTDDVDEVITEFDATIVFNRPFIKATVGADYTIGKHVYVQAQYLRGMIDEFGWGNINNYLMAGGELIFFGRHLVFRAFAVTDFPRDKDDYASVAIAPDLILVPPWGFVTFELGGFALVGDRQTKFGQAAAGSSIAYLKVTGQF